MAKNKNIDISDIWPQERDYITRPERLKYVRRLVNNDHCVFCDEVEKGPDGDGLCVYQNDHSMVVVNKYPYNTGHILILPTRHVGDILELSDDEYLSLSQLLKYSVAVIKKVYECHGLNIGMNHGQIAGAGIPDHLHWHIVPRWNGDTNFFPIIGETKVLPEDLPTTYKKLKQEFSQLKG